MLWSRKGVSTWAVASGLAILLMATSLGQRTTQASTTDAEGLFHQAISLELQREWAPALEAARQAVAMDPWTAKYVDKQARLAGFIMLDQLAAGERAAAEGIAGELLDLEQQWANRPASAKGARLNAATLLRFGQAHFLMGDLDGAASLLKASRVGLLNTEADVWLYALYESRGDAKQMKRLAGKPWVQFRGYNPVYLALHG